MRLHRVVLDAREAVRALHDHVGLVEAGGAAPAREVELVADVAAGDRPQRGQVGEVAGLRLPVWTSGAPGASASSSVVTAGSGSYSTSIASSAAWARLVRGEGGGHRLALVAGDVLREDRPVAERGAVEGIAEVEVGAVITACTPGSARARRRSSRRCARGRGASAAPRRGACRAGQVGREAGAPGDLVDRVVRGTRWPTTRSGRRAPSPRAVAPHARIASTIFR